MKVEASAPAKVILVGEHFVVENEPAIACAVELRAHVTVEDGYDDILLSSQNFGSSIKLSIKGDILDGRENLKIFEPLLRIDRILRRMTDFKGGYKLEVNSSIPPASGMGSSAAVAVATVAAVSKIMGLELDLEEISKIIPSEISLTNLSIFSEKKKNEGQTIKVSLSGFAPTRKSLFYFRKKLKEAEFFKNVSFPPSNWIKPTDIDFSINFEVKLKTIKEK